MSHETENWAFRKRKMLPFLIYLLPLDPRLMRTLSFFCFSPHNRCSIKFHWLNEASTCVLSAATTFCLEMFTWSHFLFKHVCQLGLVIYYGENKRNFQRNFLESIFSVKTIFWHVNRKVYELNRNNSLFRHYYPLVRSSLQRKLIPRVSSVYFA